MSSVPQPHRGVDLILGGAESLTNSLGQRQARLDQEKAANAPINPLQAKMLELALGGKKRILAGEDPDEVLAELKEHPIAQQYRQAAMGGGLAAPAMGQAQAPQQAAPQPQPQVERLHHPLRTLLDMGSLGSLWAPLHPSRKCRLRTSVARTSSPSRLSPNLG